MEKKKRARPSLHPQPLSETAWYYEYPGRIDVIVEVRDETGICKARALTVSIPWEQLLASLKRCQP